MKTSCPLTFMTTCFPSSYIMFIERAPFSCEIYGRALIILYASIDEWESTWRTWKKKVLVPFFDS